MSYFCLRALLGLLLTVSTGCFSKIWQGGIPIEERNFDVYGTVVSISLKNLVVKTKEGEQTFLFDPASVKGSDTFDEGQIVHVLYKKLDTNNIITLVVKKVD